MLLKPPGPNDGDASVFVTKEALAHTYQQIGRLDEAAAWYQQFAAGNAIGPLGWEPQQRLLDAYYTLATDYQQGGDRARALAELAQLLDRWKDADLNLPLLKKARLLRDQLIAGR